MHKMKKILFELTNITKTYSSMERPALAVDELSIPKNAMVAIIGFSGSGKTTLLNILGGLDQPDHLDKLHKKDSSNNETSQINYYGQNGEFTNLSDAVKNNIWRRQTFGYIFQEGYLMDNLTNRENINTPLYINGYEPEKRVIDSLLDQVGISQLNIPDDLPANISGGEMQRIAIVRSIVHNPEVILADEPSSSLDYENGMKVMYAFKNWCVAKKNRTVIWVTHNIEQASQLADYIIVLKDGKPVHKKALQNPKDQGEILKMLSEDYVAPEDSKWTVQLNKSDAPLINIMKFGFKFAFSDIFPVEKRTFSGLLPFLFGRKNAQWLNMASMVLVIVLSLFFISVNLILKNYFKTEFTQSIISKIVVKQSLIGDPQLNIHHEKKLSSLKWVKGKGLNDPAYVAWDEKIKKETLNDKIIGPATIGAYGFRLMQISCKPNKDSDSLFDRTISLWGVAINIEDPMLKKLFLINAENDLSEDSENINKTIYDEVKDKKGIDGVFITKKALIRLGYKNAPKNITINSLEGKSLDLPIFGVSDLLPSTSELLVTSNWFLKKYFSLSVNDPVPGFETINVYVDNDVDKWLPICDAIENLGFKLGNDVKERLLWVKNMTEFISKFSYLAMIGVLILMGFLLFTSYAQAIQKKRREIGVLMAEGMTSGGLYALFSLELLIVWVISAAIAIPFHFMALNYVQQFIMAKFITINTQQIFMLPQYIIPEVLLTIFIIAIFSVFSGVKKVIKKNIAETLRSV